MRINIILTLMLLLSASSYAFAQESDSKYSVSNYTSFQDGFDDDPLLDDYPEPGVIIYLKNEPSKVIVIPDKIEYNGKLDWVVALNSYFFPTHLNPQCKDIPQNIKLGSDVLYLGKSTFDGCTSLSDINLEGVERIGMRAFNNCKSLKEVNFLGDQWWIEQIQLYCTAFNGCSSLEKVTLGSPTSKILIIPVVDDTGINCSVFDGADNLREVAILNQVTTDQKYFLTACNYDYFIHQDGLYPDVFGPAPNVTTLSVDNLETLSCTAYSPLESMVAVKNLKLGENMKALDLHRFIKVGGITNIEVLAKEPPVLKISDDNMFNYADCYLTVPEESVELYRNADVWREFATINGMSNVVKIEADSTAPVYYNLHGVKVDNPVNGLFIKVVDGKATKVRL